MVRAGGSQGLHAGDIKIGSGKRAIDDGVVGRSGDPPTKRGRALNVNAKDIFEARRVGNLRFVAEVRFSAREADSPLPGRSTERRLHVGGRNRGEPVIHVAHYRSAFDVDAFET